MQEQIHILKQVNAGRVAMTFPEWPRETTERRMFSSIVRDDFYSVFDIRSGAIINILC